MILTETILVIRDVGIQVKTIYLGGRSSSRFIDRSKISDIIINEAITMMHIRVYMAIIVEGQDRMVVVFQVSIGILFFLMSRLRERETDQFGNLALTWRVQLSNWQCVS